MKILAIAHESEFNGGANRSFYSILSVLREKYGAEISVILPNARGALCDALMTDGIEYNSYPYKCDFSVYRNEFKDIVKRFYVRLINAHNLLLAQKAAKEYRTKNYDVVYVNTRMSSFGAFFAKELDIPMVCHIREFGNPCAIWGCWTLKSVGEYSQQVIAISTAMSKEIEKHIDATKIVTILNGVDYPSSIVREGNWARDKIHILLTGRVVDAKGHFDALEALNLLKKAGYHNLILHIAGTVPQSTNALRYQKLLEQFIVDKDLSDSVIFHGEVKEIQKLRAEMNIELMCSVCEPFGRVTVEAMRDGLLVIGANTGGTLDIIRDGKTGLLYEQGNPMSLASKIEWVIDHPQQRLEIQKNGYESVRERFTRDANATEVYRVLCKVSGGKNSWRKK